MVDPNTTVWLLWGKTGNAPAGGGPEQKPVHPLLCHMIDVAVVARSLWDQVLTSAFRQRVSLDLEMPMEAVAAWVAFMAGLHDLGKASPAFQSRFVPAYRRLSDAGLSTDPKPHEAPHGVLTAVLLRDETGAAGWTKPLALKVGAALGGHHGLFPQPLQVSNVPPSARGTGAWVEARHALLRMLAEACGVKDSAPPLQFPHAAAMALSGLVSVADWIGSDERHFPYALRSADGGMEETVSAYASRAGRQATHALAALSWTGWTPSSDRLSFRDLFPSIGEPNVVQQAVIDLSREVEGQQSLVILEAPMGLGKTEGALYLADGWGARAGQRGCYFALPTMATSNQMFGRMVEVLRRRYPGQPVNVQLLHGHALLSAELELLRDRRQQAVVPSDIHDEQDHTHGVQANVIAAEWFTYRKRGLLAPFGVGTIDQALLGALQARHVFVRLFGLAHKVVVIDEVHAYDTYMTSLLERLLEWLGALGSSVALLSATLPDARRRQLARAFARGLGVEDGADLDASPYPRLTWVTHDRAGTHAIAPQNLPQRTVRLQWVDGRVSEVGGEFPLGAKLQQALAGGGCAAVLCNTVRRAQQVYEALKPYFTGMASDGAPELDLFHAQYLYEDREARERRALRRFGKPDGLARRTGGGGDSASQGPTEDVTAGRVHRPWRAVLVATQVIEQSLDLDFDLMVTDHAPADLLLQRSGRLHRHARGSRPTLVDEPALWICSPEAMDGDVPHFDRGTELVYDLHVLLRSWMALCQCASLDVPMGVEALVEAVYGEAQPPIDASASLHARWNSTLSYLREQEMDEEAEARDRWIKSPSYRGPLWELATSPRQDDAPDLHQAFQALTRLAAPSAQVVFAYHSPSGPCLDAAACEPLSTSAVPSLELVKRLLRRSATISDQRVVSALIAMAPPSGWQQSSLLRHYRLLCLDRAGNAQVGRCQIHVDPEQGVVVRGLDA